jgi:hypothetical protein
METEEHDAFANSSRHFRGWDLHDLTEQEQELYKNSFLFNERGTYYYNSALTGTPYEQSRLLGWSVLTPFRSNIKLRQHIGQLTLDSSYLKSHFLDSLMYGGGKGTTILPEIESLKREFAMMKQEIAQLKDAQGKLKDIIYQNVASYGSESIRQMIPVHIYINEDDPNRIYTIYQSVLDFLEVLGFETTIDFEARKGSWLKDWISTSKKAMTSKEVTDRLKEAEYAVEVNTILKPQSEVEKNQSEALLNILKSLEGTHHGVIRIGSLLVVKVTSKDGEVNVQVRTLNILELHTLNRHPELLNQPQHILSELVRIIDNQQSAEDNHLPLSENES